MSPQICLPRRENMDLALGVPQGVMESPGPTAHPYPMLEASQPHPSSTMAPKPHPYQESHPKKGKTPHTAPGGSTAGKA